MTRRRGEFTITLFKYFLREIIPQFLTSFCVLSAVIVISQLVKLTEVLVTFGITLDNILLPFLFIMVPFLYIIIPISYLFAVLISFSRLSADGEFIAMLASGYSLRKASIPVFIIGAFLYGLGVYCAMNYEAWGRREILEFYSAKTQTELDNMIKTKMQSGVFLDNFLGYVLYAEEISKDRTQFTNILLAPGTNIKDQDFTLMAPSATLSGTVKTGDLKMSFEHGVFYSSKPTTSKISIVKFKKAELDLLRLFPDQVFGSEGQNKDDYRSFTAAQLWNYVDEMRGSEGTLKHELYLKSRVLLHQRIGMPFAVIIFAIFAMVLGIQDERRGKSLGYLGAIATIIGSYVVSMGFKWMSEKAMVSAPAGAWIPNLLLLSIALFLLYQRNRLPPSESTLDPRLFPGFGRFQTRKAAMSLTAVR